MLQTLCIVLQTSRIILIHQNNTVTLMHPAIHFVQLPDSLLAYIHLFLMDFKIC